MFIQVSKIIIFFFISACISLAIPSFYLVSLCDAPESFQLGIQDPASPIAQGLIGFHDYLMFFIVIIGFFVCWMLVLIVIKFNEKINKVSNTFTHSSNLEIIWTLIPALILLFIAIPSFTLLYSIDEVVTPELTLKVNGHQWYWSYEYSDFGSNLGLEVDGTLSFDSYMISTDNLTLGSLRLLEVDNRVFLPVNTHIRLLITASDVLHSWALPSGGIKADATPGRLTEVGAFFNRVGVFYGQCSEICGVNHGFMPIVVVTTTLDEFKRIILNKFNLGNSLETTSNVSEESLDQVEDLIGGTDVNGDSLDFVSMNPEPEEDPDESSVPEPSISIAPEGFKSQSIAGYFIQQFRAEHRLFPKEAYLPCVKRCAADHTYILEAFKLASTGTSKDHGSIKVSTFDCDREQLGEIQVGIFIPFNKDMIVERCNNINTTDDFILFGKGIVTPDMVGVDSNTFENKLRVRGINVTKMNRIPECAEKYAILRNINHNFIDIDKIPSFTIDSNVSVFDSSVEKKAADSIVIDFPKIDSILKNLCIVTEDSRKIPVKNICSVLPFNDKDLFKIQSRLGTETLWNGYPVQYNWTRPFWQLRKGGDFPYFDLLGWHGEIDVHIYTLNMGYFKNQEVMQSFLLRGGCRMRRLVAHQGCFRVGTLFLNENYRCNILYDSAYVSPDELARIGKIIQERFSGEWIGRMHTFRTTIQGKNPDVCHIVTFVVWPNRYLANQKMDTIIKDDFPVIGDPRRKPFWKWKI